MPDHIASTGNKTGAVQKPMRRQMLRATILLALALSVLLELFFVLFFTRVRYRQYDQSLEEIIVYVEHHLDADELRRCVETNTQSDAYERMQEFLNSVIDDLGLEYLYIVIPEEEIMRNVISATSAAEFASGEDNMLVNEISTAYSREELSRFRSFWDADGVCFFEESSEYGDYYTGVKPLRGSDGSTVALICADESISALHVSLRRAETFSLLILIAIFVLFVLVMNGWLRKKVTDPLLSLEHSVNDYAESSRAAEDILQVRYDPPAIESQNEVQSLAESFRQMAEDLRSSAEKTVQAQMRAEQIESENRRLEEEARAAAKISALTASMRSLFENIPGMAFSKDAETGKYLACNRDFAQYANRSTTEEVVGLTDYDIFDAETAAHFVEDDRIALQMNRPYVFLEDVPDALGTMRHFQTTKLRFTDSAGRQCILGMCADVTELTQMREETKEAKLAYEQARSSSVTYSHIAQALAADYSSLYYVDLDTDAFIAYKSDAARGALAVETRGEDFFNKARSDAEHTLHEDDLPMFLDSCTRRSVLAAMKERGVYTLTYRQKQGKDGESVYLNMKVSRMSGDDRHIIIGISDVDAQMRYQEAVERIQEERTTYARVSALAGDYICMYTVDPETDRYNQYSATKAYTDLGLTARGEDFFERSRKDAVKAIAQEDLERFESMFTKENIMEEIRKNGVFAMTYRLVIENVPTYVTLKAAIIQEKDGPQMIIALSNVDAQIRRDMEYEHNLSMAQIKANLDALTGAGNKHAYIDAETELNRRIESEGGAEFAVIALDVNNLKLENDTKGHAAGDRLLKQAYGIITRIFAKSSVFRVGGDEFTVISEGEDYAHIDELMERLHASNEINALTGDTIVASGMARYDGDRSVQAVFERADSKMYKEKKRLKNIGTGGTARL